MTNEMKTPTNSPFVDSTSKPVLRLVIEFYAPADNQHSNNTLDCVSMADYLCCTLSEQLLDNTAPGQEHKVTGHYETTNAVSRGDGSHPNNAEMLYSAFLDEGGY